MCRIYLKIKSQAIMEYFIILAVVVSLTLLGLSSKAGGRFFAKVKNATASYFSQTAEKIVNANSDSENGGGENK